jgi:GDPmannose 4,6-dehydratase
LSKGYEVHGLIRRSSTFNTSRIDHIYQDPHDTDPKLFLHYGDLIDGVGLTNLVREIKPTEVYNLGAQSHVQVSFTMPQYTGQVDAVGAVGLLEAIRSAELILVSIRRVHLSCLDQRHLHKMRKVFSSHAAHMRQQS